MSRVELKQVKTASYEIADITTQIDFMTSYISLLACQVNGETGHDKATVLYSSLIHEGTLSNLVQMLTTINGKLNNASNLLLDIHENMEEKN